jgi:hypothetical protein
MGDVGGDGDEGGGSQEEHEGGDEKAAGMEGRGRHGGSLLWREDFWRENAGRFLFCGGREPVHHRATNEKYGLRGIK